MADFYLVTGFLGAGKTTFLKQLAGLLAPRKIHLIINEFGSEGIDGMLLSELGAALDEIKNGSIFCACRLDKFEEALEDALAHTPDVIIAETSGLSDPTNVRRVLAQFPEIEYKGSICLADALRLPKVYRTALMVHKQLAISSLVLLNKTDLATPKQCQEAKDLIMRANPATQVRTTQFGKLEPQWLELLTPSPDVEKAAASRDVTLQKACIAVANSMTKDAFAKCLDMLCESTYRIKGFVQLAEGTYFADCTGPQVQLIPWQGIANNRIVLLAGKGMPLRKTIKAALSWYPGLLFQAPEEF